MTSIAMNVGIKTLRSIIFDHLDPSIDNLLTMKGAFTNGNSTFLLMALTPAHAIG